MRRIYPPEQPEFAVHESCMDALEPAFEQLIDRAVLAGWPQEMVIVALVGLAQGGLGKGRVTVLNETA
jgi:hypothetical protein